MKERTTWGKWTWTER